MLLSVVGFGPAAETNAADQPNILFLAIDDLNDWVGCLDGHPQVKTPHIDALAARGTLFTNAHCQAPLCHASRASLLTGLRPSTTGVYGLGPWFRRSPGYEDVLTLPQALSCGGYETLTAGKIYHGEFGWKLKEEFDVVGPGSGPGITPKQKLVQTPHPNPWVDWGTFDHEDNEKQDYKIATWVEDQLRRNREKPFFLAAGFFLPHVPCYTTQQWFDLYPENELILPPIKDDDRDDCPRFSWYLHWDLPEPRLKYLREADQHRNLVRSYLACISFVDAQVGRCLDALAASPHADNTIVVLWSDHGWHLGEKLITGKNTLWERSTRVPLVFAGPGCGVNAICDQPVELLDIYPTLMELAGLKTPQHLEGLSLMPQLVEPTAKRTHPAITTQSHDNHAVVDDRFRYIRYADGSEELYDRLSDPNEWDNLASDPAYAQHKDRLSRSLPDVNRRPIEGSRGRILERADDGAIRWEGKPVASDAPIPGT